MSFCNPKLLVLPSLLLGVLVANAEATITTTAVPSIITPLLLKSWTVPEAKTVEFAIFSDPHLYETSLGVGGSAWDTYLAGDRKLLAESEALLSATVDALIVKHPDFVLVPGDLTKDGEKLSHRLFATYMAKLESNGIEVFVIPGNHDVANPHAVRYQGETTVAVDSITAREFSSIYGEYGYNQAFSRDAHSLSYAVRVNSKVWLIGLDSCQYDNAYTTPVIAGLVQEETLAWAEDVLTQANAAGARVIAMMHHGLMEHYTGQASDGIGNNYVVGDYAAVGQRLGEAGLRMVFTGHFHAQDIASTTITLSDGSTAQVFDVETGSLVTYPNPYRLASLSPEGNFALTTQYIDDIDRDLAPNSAWDPAAIPFADYSLSFLQEGLTTLVTSMLTSGYGISAEQAATIAPHIVAAFAAHYAGNESITPEAQSFIQYLLSSPDPTYHLLAHLLGNLWTDPGEDDSGQDRAFPATSHSGYAAP